MPSLSLLSQLRETLDGMPANISAGCFEDIPSPTYDRHLFAFETDFDYWAALFWFQAHWRISYYFVAAYLAAILAGRRLMRSRPAFHLRRPLVLWNVALALFSLAAFCRVFPAILHNVRHESLHALICHTGWQQHKQACAMWGWLFALSKVLELGDTAFIVLRKKPLIFLHWYHHVSVLLFVWGSSAYPSVMHQYFMAVNVLVHTFMYSYYALKAAGVAMPRRIGVAITSLQLLQMVAGVQFIGFSYAAKRRDPYCCVFEQAIVLGVAIYTSYLVLFLNFFIKAYVTNKPVMESAGLGKKAV